MRTVWYFGLEPLKERYTYQLSNVWMPETFKFFDLEYVPIEGVLSTGKQIRVGAVLDAVGRGQYALSQCSNFLDLIREEKVKDGDVIFLQDYWTAGIEGIFYALDLYGYKDIKVYAMLHAQSVDEYDFTYQMRNWMRLYELGLDQRMSGIFVGSTIHKLQLREAGYKAPIHVVSLPLHYTDVVQTAPKNVAKVNNVIFTSRLDKEKNPYFLLEVADKFLTKHKDWSVVLTTSGSEFRSSIDGLVKDLYSFAGEQPRFKLLKDLSKREYYYELKKARIQFNCSLQDYVSWTSLEADSFNCTLVYPNFRSFKEIHYIKHKYDPFSVEDALKKLEDATETLSNSSKLAKTSDLGRLLEGWIIANDYSGSELNIWHEEEYIRKLILK